MLSCQVLAPRVLPQIALEGTLGDRAMTVVEPKPAVPCQVEAAIKRRCGWQIHDLRVEAANQLVVLRGWASTYYAKQLAQHTAMAVIGLAVLENRIVVH
jgi:hypothetical protein